MPAIIMQKGGFYPPAPTPDRDPAARVRDRLETRAVPNILSLFRDQAARCFDCSEKRCNRGEIPQEKISGRPSSQEQLDADKGCPLNTRIPDWMAKVSSPKVTGVLERLLSEADAGKLTWQALDDVIRQTVQDPRARRELREGFDFAMQRNPLPEFTGQTCPTSDGLCEGGSLRTGASCVAGEAGHGPLTIGNIENLLGYIGRKLGWLQETLGVPVSSPRRIAIIGAGPGGLAAAVLFRRAGYEVSLWTREKHIGGMLMYGLPGTKLDKGTVLDYEGILQRSGIKIHTGVEVDAAAMAAIASAHDKVILAVGAQKANRLGIEGEDKAGVVDALDFIGQSIRSGNLRDLGVTDDQVSPARAAELDARGKHVVVIGGGDTAMDAVRESIRMEAASTKLVYRGPASGLRAVEKEIKRAKEEGIAFVYSRQPLHIKGGEVTTEIVFTPNPVPPDAQLDPHKADLVVRATGFAGEDGLAGKLGIPGLQQYKNNNGIKVWDFRNADFRLALNDGVGPERPSDKFHAIGDAVQIDGGSCLVVWAIHNATKAFARIHRGFTVAAL
jgi:glutamate synthase (NADPH/NADH) small chain